MILLVAVAALLVVPTWVTRHWEPPPPMSAPTAWRHLLSCCAVFLMALVARGDPLIGDLWAWALGASVLFTALLVLTLIHESQENYVPLQ